jgi:hypothetical protein
VCVLVRRSILLRRFPGRQRSGDVAGWAESAQLPVTVPGSPAFQDLSHRVDACGLVELAGKAVGASFVGTVAACLAVAGAVRELHGGSGSDITTIDLDTMHSTRAPATVSADVIALPLTIAPRWSSRPFAVSAHAEEPRPAKSVACWAR